ncbi:MAG: general secretion pathway protein GspK [Candidatus Omnitrophica bacterium]|nr:general secretion pathway protein GspK [Candidatus Omnitrophota bacterium]
MESKVNDGGAKGSILIIVLWSLFFLAMLAVAVNSYVWPRLEVSSRLLGKAKMRYIASAGIRRAILEIKNDSTETYDSLHDTWSDNDEAFKEVPFGGGTFSAVRITPADKSKPEYGLTDEESKININKAPASVLQNLLKQEAGVADDDASAIADSILDWRDSDDALHKDGHESDYYEGLNEHYECKNGDFESLEELLLVYGMTRDIFDKIQDIITIYGEGSVNVNTAGLRVLMAIGLDKGSAEKIMAFREKENTAEDGDTPDNIFTDASSIAEVLNDEGESSGEDADAASIARAATMLSVKSDNFRGDIAASLSQGGISEKITFIYDRSKGLVKYWREE